jgi:hypothetical protein
MSKTRQAAFASKNVKTERRSMALRGESLTTVFSMMMRNMGSGSTKKSNGLSSRGSIADTMKEEDVVVEIGCWSDIEPYIAGSESGNAQRAQLSAFSRE